MKPTEVTAVTAVEAAVAETPVIAAPAIDAVAAPREYTLFQDLVMLTKARLTMLVLVTTAIGFLFGSGRVDWFLFFRVVFGTAFVASGASVLNQYLERNVDRLMHRTQDRPLPAGRMSPGTALGLGVLLGVAGVIYLTNRVSPLCAELAGGTLFLYVAIYTPLKRKSAWCVTVGAVSGAIPPVVGWAAATGRLGAGAWILFGILFFWQMPHFLALAWMYRDEYAQAGFSMLRRGDITGAKAAGESLLCAIALTIVTLLPVFLHLAHLIYAPVALLCDAGLLCCAGFFLSQRNRDSARRLFLSSILYLPLVLALLAICRR
ncbi:MAG TPA: heme o synthase [Chthoniobacteraceae bacterium]|nr:heme o synthase [Chthoniobacteraceae bacterium]